jgi:UDPglucose 6-dehydrogenase
MNVQIVGYGIVGKAQEFLMRRLGHNVTVYDPYVLPESRLSQNVDITFICTSEDSVDGAIERLMKSEVQGLYVIKSTVPVGTTEGLMEKHRIHICHNPEFLREKHAMSDVMAPSRVVIGECCTPHGALLEKLYSPLNRPIYRTNPVTSELIKLVSNSLRAIMISFWNELYILCQKLGADVTTIAEAADPARVIGEWEGGKWGTKFFGAPYMGKCIPKDVKHLIATFEKSGLSSHVLEASEKVNRRLLNVH